jgi:hypothetical protein
MATNMRHVVEFTDAFAIAAIVSTLSTQLSWSKSCMQHCLKRVSGWRGAGVLCDGDSGYAAVGDLGGWDWGGWDALDLIRVTYSTPLVI